MESLVPLASRALHALLGTVRWDILVALAGRRQDTYIYTRKTIVVTKAVTITKSIDPYLAFFCVAGWAAVGWHKGDFLLPQQTES